MISFLNLDYLFSNFSVLWDSVGMGTWLKNEKKSQLLPSWELHLPSQVKDTGSDLLWFWMEVTQVRSRLHSVPVLYKKAIVLHVFEKSKNCILDRFFRCLKNNGLGSLGSWVQCCGLSLCWATASKICSYFQGSISQTISKGFPWPNVL